VLQAPPVAAKRTIEDFVSTETKQRGQPMTKSPLGCDRPKKQRLQRRRRAMMVVATQRLQIALTAQI